MGVILTRQTPHPRYAESVFTYWRKFWLSSSSDFFHWLNPYMNWSNLSWLSSLKIFAMLYFRGRCSMALMKVLSLFLSNSLPGQFCWRTKLNLSFRYSFSQWFPPTRAKRLIFRKLLILSWKLNLISSYDVRNPSIVSNFFILSRNSLMKSSSSFISVKSRYTSSYPVLQLYSSESLWPIRNFWYI